METLLSLKSQYKELTGEDLAGGRRQDRKRDNKGGQQKEDKPNAVKPQENAAGHATSKEVGKVTRYVTKSTAFCYALVFSLKQN